MRFLTVLVGVASACLLLPVACSHCCSEQDETYLLSGPYPAQAGSCPSIVAEFYEGESSACASDCGSTDVIPGRFVLEQSLGSSSTWSVSVPVHYANNLRPGIDIELYCDLNQNGHFEMGEPCIGSTSLAPGSQTGVTFEGSTCGGRF